MGRDQQSLFNMPPHFTQLILSSLQLVSMGGWLRLFIHAFSKHWLTIYCVQGTVLGPAKRKNVKKTRRKDDLKKQTKKKREKVSVGLK